MLYLQRLFCDFILEIVEVIERITQLFKTKKTPSLLVLNINWCTKSEWMDRLVSYRQLELWTHSK